MKRKLTKRQTIKPKGGKRYIRRLAKGQPDGGEITKSVSLKKSLSADDRRKAKKVVKEGEGDRGDEKRNKARKK